MKTPIFFIYRQAWMTIENCMYSSIPMLIFLWWATSISYFCRPPFKNIWSPKQAPMKYPDSIHALTTETKPFGLCSRLSKMRILARESLYRIIFVISESRQKARGYLFSVMISSLFIVCFCFYQRQTSFPTSALLITRYPFSWYASFVNPYWENLVNTCF